VLEVKAKVTLGSAVGLGGFCVITGAGAPDGVTLFEGTEAGPSPAALVAVTVNVYAVSLVRPVRVALVAGAATVALAPAGLEVTV
jgi:hypothetical protein